MDRTEKEKTLIKQLSEKDSSAWKEFLTCYGGLIYSQVYYTLQRSNFKIPEDEINDAVQSLLQNLMENNCKKLLTFEGRGGCSLASWLRTVATNHTLSIIRSKKQTVPIDDVNEDKLHKNMEDSQGVIEKSPRDKAFDKQILDRLQKAISKLPPRQQVIFQLYYKDEWKSQQIADFMRLTPNNVDQILFQIRKEIQNYLDIDDK
jgi:RNA polymerase sigma-70 factor (ECF subfamily)